MSYKHSFWILIIALLFSTCGIIVLENNKVDYRKLYLSSLKSNSNLVEAIGNLVDELNHCRKSERTK